MERMMVKEDSCGRTEYGYNTRDEISRIRDGEGNETLKLYDSLGKLICLYPPNANIKTGEGAIQFRYNYMREQDDKLYPDGSHERMKVDWEGTVLKRIHPNAYDAACDDGEGESYDYDWDKNLIRIHYPDGGVERFFRDGEGNCIKHVLPEDYQSEFDDGPGYAYTYDEENRLQQILDVDGEELICYSYDLHGNRIAMRTADGNLTYYWYDLSGNLTQKAENISKGESDSALYRRTTYSYDGDGNQTEICFYGGSWYLKQEESRCWLEEKEHEEELRLFCSYDERGRLICIKDGSGACVKYSYDVRGNRISEEQIISDEITKKVFFRYDKAGRLVEKREKIAGWSGDDFIPSVQTAVTTYQRDGNGNIIEICTPEGYQILRKYDLRDRLICERVVDKENGIDRSTYIAYDRAGNPISLCRKGADGRGYEMQYDYDLKDRLVRARDLEGAVFAYQYDANDCLVKEKRPGTVEEGGSWKYQYDRQRNLCEQKNPYGEIEEQNRYDAMGHLTVKKLADGEEMYFHYGVQGNLAGLDNHRSRREGKELQTYHYNSRGQIIGVIDGNGNKTEYTLDNWGKVTRVHAADGGMECYTYDFAGNITSTTDANGGRISYRYNSQGKVCEIIDQEGMKEHFYYDREGRQILSIDRLGNQVKTVYNIDGNPVRQISCDKDGKKRDIRIWKYDSLGYLKQSIGGGFYYNYEYRPDGKLLYKESAGQLLLKYTYFPDGNVKTMTDGSGKTLRYAYDQIGRLISITDEYGKEILNYHHTAGGKLKEICHHNGVKTTYQYDTEGNIIHLRTKTKEDNLLCDLQYEYDLNGNRTAKMGSMVLPDALGNISLQSRDIHYRYDGRNRLLSELSGKQETCYRYDLCGNRLEKRQGKRKEENYYNKKNQLKERISGNDTWKYFYDKQGNLIQESGPKRNLQYTYDTQNRQTYILSGQTVIQENRYDGEGLRAGLNIQGKESTFLFTNGNLALELDEFNQPVKRYIRGYGAAALEHYGIYHEIHRDEQLSTGWITGVSGEIENACEYDAFGNLLGSHEEVPNCILYGGQQYDAETGQYYLRARYYNPVIGRFIQEDPYRGDGLNLYAYCRNNPVVYYDPSGNECVGNSNAKENVQKENVTDPKNNETLKYRNWDGEIPRSGDEWEVFFKEKYGMDAVIRNTWDLNEIKSRYYGNLKKVNVVDTNADLLAERIGGISRVRFEFDWDFREFDAISDDYIAQAKPALSSANPTVKTQMKATFEAAKATGKKVYYQFEGKPDISVINKLMEYSNRYGIDIIIDTESLNK